MSIWGNAATLPAFLIDSHFNAHSFGVNGIGMLKSINVPDLLWQTYFTVWGQGRRVFDFVCQLMVLIIMGRTD